MSNLNLEYSSVRTKLEHIVFPLEDIVTATHNFAEENLLKRGKVVDVYKGKLLRFNECINVVIRRFINQKYEKIRNKFYVEIEMLSRCKHPNLLTLLGFCDEDSEMILVFEGDFEGALDRYLGRTGEMANFTWEQRIRICLDVANGLKYLLDNMDDKSSMIYEELQSANILLDKNWTAKIANFGIAKFMDDKSSMIHQGIQSENGLLDINLYTKIADFRITKFKDKNNIGGTYMYLDSNHVMMHRESNHVYSLGVILSEILTGKLADAKGPNNFNLRRRGFNVGKQKGIADPNIMEEVQECSLRKGPNQDSLDTFFKITNQCLAYAPSERPTLGVVIDSLEKSLHFQVRLKHLKIPLYDIQLATENFHEKNLLGFGGYGAVYKGDFSHIDSRVLLETQENNTHGLPKIHNTVAIKRIFQREDGQGKEGFISELDALSICEHPNIVSLLGFCVEGDEMLLVFEHASRGSLDAYFGSSNNMVDLTWAQRLRICIDVAHGLNFLHTTFEEKKWMVHRDIKSDNILLGMNWEAKIADFGLSKFHTPNQQHSTINTNNIAGTNVYLDPEYARTHRLKRASDIYSFGVVLFEIFSGTLAYDSKYTSENEKGLAPIASTHYDNGTLKEILDPKIMDEAHEHSTTLKIGPCHESLTTFSKIAYRCLKKSQAERPTIEEVIKELQEALKLQENWRDIFKMSLEEITLGVGNFSDENYIIRGYGKLYRGEVQHNSEHKMVVVRRFSRLGQEHGFLREFEVLFKHKQENIIGLVGYCKELDEKIIVYEDASNGCLSRYLNDTSFSWSTRLKICIDIANGLHFLHGGSVGQDVVIHRDIKSSNILLTEDWKAKIWGFEHALTYPANKEIKYLKNDVVGSPGYCDPLYWETHTLTKESDIYSFGVVLFEILCGRMACPQDFTDSSLFLDVLVKRHFQVARVEEIVFEGIKEQVVLESLATFRRIAFQCLHEKREERPTAGEVVAHLQKALEFQESYEIWEAKLPRNYKEILQFSKSPEIYTTMVKKDIHDILSKGILLKDDKLWFSIADSGERSEMVASRMFSFRNRWSHRWRSIQESRFPKVAEMLDITNLNILIKIRPQFLPSDVNYSVHLVFKFCCPRKSNAQRMYVNLKYKIGKENSHAYFAMWREDNWMTIELCRYSNLKKDTSFEILLQEFSRCYCDSRAIYIEGIEFRVIDNVKQEKMEKLEENQQVLTSPSEMEREVMVSAKSVVYDTSNLEYSAQSSIERTYKVPRQQVFCIKLPLYEYLSSLVIEGACACYLVFNLSENCHGLHCPVIVRDKLHRKSKEIIYFRSPSPWNLHDTDRVPKKRRDGWMEVLILEFKFHPNLELNTEYLSRKLKLISYQGTLSGLIIRGLEFRPIGK